VTCSPGLSPYRRQDGLLLTLSSSLVQLECEFSAFSWFVLSPVRRRLAQHFYIFATFDLPESNLSEALKHAETAYAGTNDPHYGLHAVVLAAELGRSKIRDDILHQILEKGKQYLHKHHVRTEMIKLATLLQAAFAEGGMAKLDLKAVDGIPIVSE